MVCRACATRLPLNGGSGSDQIIPGTDSYEAQIADVEMRLAALTLRVQAAHAAREALVRRATAVSHPQLAEQTAPTIDVGTLRVSFGGPHGAEIETAAALLVDESPATPTEPEWDLPAVDARSEAEAAVWNALASGASIVRIDSGRGGGATMLLHALAAGAHDHGFTHGALFATGVCGPAIDVAQRLAALLDPIGRGRRYYAAADLPGSFSDVHALVLLDRAKLTARDSAELAELFPGLRFVLVHALALPQTPTVVLGPLRVDKTATLIESAFGRSIDTDNRGVALDICKTVGPLPGRTRLIGIAARELRRSFISLGVQFETGDAIIRELIGNLTPAAQSILGALALARAPLPAHHLAYVVGSGEIRASLDHLSACELVRVCGGETYELPSYVEQLVPPLADPGAAFARVVDVLCDVLDPAQALPVLDCQLAGAESILQSASDRSQWGHVLVLGPRLAETFAARGAFGAWARVLGLVEAAAICCGDTAALNLARHEFGVRAVLLGEHAKAMRYLRSAARDRKAVGDEAGAAASAAVLALADHELPAVDRLLEQEPGPEPVSPVPYAPVSVVPAFAQAESSAGTAPSVLPRLLTLRTLLLLGLGTVVGVVLLALSFRSQPNPTPAITEFSANPISITSGRAAELCVDATDAAIVEIFPDAARLPGTGNHCLAVRPAVTTTYVAVGTTVDGRQTQRAVTVAVHAADVPRQPRITAFSASPARIRAGQTTRLCYAVTGANFLRIVPRLGNLTRLRSCRTMTLREPRRYVYRLSATNENGGVAIRQVRVDVVASASRPAAANARNALDRRLARAVYQFDATPSVVSLGQTTSLCVGVERPARAFVTHLGPLQPGITRCYRVQPRATTVYRLYVALQKSTALETLTVAVRPSARRRDVAREEHR